jgi:hypothetical protein
MYQDIFFEINTVVAMRPAATLLGISYFSKMMKLSRVSRKSTLCNGDLDRIFLLPSFRVLSPHSIR